MEVIFRGGGRWRTTLYDHMRGQTHPAAGLRLVLALLRLGSWLYRLLATIHANSYAWGFARRRRLSCRVVSIGNVTVGGTGKTPMTIWLARWLSEQGWRVAVLSRGYGGLTTDKPQVVSTGDGPLQSWTEVGDEPYLMAQELRGVPILVGKDRYLSGEHARKHFGSQILVLDDGFQHHRLARDLDIVLVDATNPFGHGTLLPRGILREPLRALKRADAVILTRTELAPEALGGVTQTLRRWLHDQPIYQVTTQVSALGSEERLVGNNPICLRERRVVAFAGIGNPESFAATLTDLGCEIAALIVFPDHHPYTEHDWRVIIDVMDRYKAEGLVTTTKDRVRLARSWQTEVSLYTLGVEVAFSADAAPFQQQLQTLLTYANNRQ